jgi:hypothetical protein
MIRLALCVLAAALAIAPAAIASDSHADGRCTRDHVLFSETSATGAVASSPVLPAWTGAPWALTGPVNATTIYAAADASTHAMHALAHVAIGDSPPNDCSVNTRVRDTVTVLPGGGRRAGDAVRLVLDPGFHAAFSEGPQFREDDSLTTIDAFASVTFHAPSAEDPIASFVAQVRQQSDASSGSPGTDPDGSLTADTRWSWELHSNAAPDGGDADEEHATVCHVWPNCTILITDPQLAPFSVATGGRSIVFEATVGEPIAIDAKLNLLVQAAGGASSASADLLRTLQFALAPAPGYEGATIAYASSGAATPAADQVVNATSPAGAVVTYAPSATCSPASGGTFPIGATTVTCAGGSFTVTVRGAKEQLAELIRAVVASTHLSPAAKTRLTAALQALLSRLDLSKPAHRLAVCLALQAFSVQPQAAEWAADASRIRAVLACCRGRPAAATGRR